VFIRNESGPEGIYVSVVGRTLRSDDQEEIAGGVVFFSDITKEKEAADTLQRTVVELRNQTHFMQTVAESMNESIFVAKRDGNLMWANPRMEQMIGVGIVLESPDEGPGIYGVYCPDRETMVPAAQLSIIRALRGEVLDDVELFIRNEKKPEGVHISVSERPLLDENYEIHDRTRHEG